MATRKWTHDTLAEQVLNKWEVKFRVAVVRIDEIDLAASADNHARIRGKAVDSEVIQDYGLALERGDTFPRVVLLKASAGKKKYVIMGGNHRVRAADLNGDEEIEAYVFESTDKVQADLIPRQLNVGLGITCSKEEAVEHAIYAINSYGYTTKRAAEEWGLREDYLKRKISTSKMAEKLAKYGVNARRLPEATLAKLNAISDNVNVLAAAGRAILSQGMSGEEAAVFVNEVKAAETEADRMAVVSQRTKATSAPGLQPAKSTLPIYTKVKQAAGRFKNYVKGKSFDQIGAHSDDQKKEIAGVFNEIVGILRSFGKGKPKSGANGHPGSTGRRKMAQHR